MVFTYEIIHSNLEALEKVKSKIPDFDSLISVYNPQYSLERELRPYVDFARWISILRTSDKKQLIYDKLDFDFVRETVANGCSDIAIKNQIKLFTKTKFNNLLKNKKKFETWNGYRHSRYQRKIYQKNFTNSEILIINWAIQNGLDISTSIGKYYHTKLPAFLDTSLDYSNKNTAQLIERIDSFISTLDDLDLTNINYSDAFKYLHSSFVDYLKDKISISRVKCLDDDVTIGLEKDMNYDVTSTVVNTKSCSGCGSTHDVELVYQLKNFQGFMNSKRFKRINIHRMSVLEEILKS